MPRRRGLGEFGPFTARFEKSTLRFKRIDLPKAKVSVTYVMHKEEGGFRAASKEVFYQGNLLCRFVYGGWRKVGEYLLPTRLGVNEPGKAPTKFAIEYFSVNERPARLAPLDPRKVREAVQAFEAGWSKRSEAEKIASMDTLADIDHDLAVAAIAGRGLPDPSEMVRMAAAKSLGILGKRKAAPALMAALKANEKKIGVYLQVIWALGECNDPRAVPSLSKNWWTQRVKEYAVVCAVAKVHALGNIRHATSVDALIEALQKAGEEEGIWEIKKAIPESLKKLTGKDFLLDVSAWKKWWKTHRGTFKFD
ncbi:MAG: HEAT repeat domain-containing protein [Planctomycetota bacterium]